MYFTIYSKWSSNIQLLVEVFLDEWTIQFRQIFLNKFDNFLLFSILLGGGGG